MKGSGINEKWNSDERESPNNCEEWFEMEWNEIDVFELIGADYKLIVYNLSMSSYIGILFTNGYPCSVREWGYNDEMYFFILAISRFAQVFKLRL